MYAEPARWFGLEGSRRAIPANGHHPLVSIPYGMMIRVNGVRGAHVLRTPIYFLGGVGREM